MSVIYLWWNQRKIKKKSNVRTRLQRYLIAFVIVVCPYAIFRFLSLTTGYENDDISTLTQILLTTLPGINALVYGVNQSCCARRPIDTEIAKDIGKPLYDGTNVSNTEVLAEVTGVKRMTYIAAGASSSVYRGKWLGTEVAIKCIKQPDGDGEELKWYETMIHESEQDFVREAQLAALLRHPNICLFMKLGKLNGQICIVSEYCARGSLRDVLQNKSVGWDMKCKLAHDAAKGLTYLHACNPTYVHRDIKCSNILVTKDWTAKIADFGISRVAAEAKKRPKAKKKGQTPEVNSMTETSFAGTWRWNAPEIVMNPSQCTYSTATDMYSFGISLWEIATNGCTPFEKLNFDHQVRKKVLKGERPVVNRLHNDTSPEFVDLMYRCWAQDPKDRPTAEEAKDILGVLSDQFNPKRSSFRSSWFFGSIISLQSRFSVRPSATSSSSRSSSPLVVDV